MEEWKQVIESYEISSYGNLRRKLHDGTYRSIVGCIQNKGYRYFQLLRDGKRYNYLFHQLVAEAFIGERPDGNDIDHIDRNKLNNNISNLRYVSHNINMKNTDKYRHDIPCSNVKDRKRILRKEYDLKIGHNQNIRRRKGTGQIYKRGNSYRAIITINKVKYEKSFQTKQEAEDYLLMISESFSLMNITIEDD